MSDLMFSISEAMDIAHHKLALHQLRTAYICWKMAEEAALPPAQIEKLFLAAMLHDIGAFTAQEKISHYDFEANNCEQALPARCADLQSGTLARAFGEDGAPAPYAVVSL